MSESRAETARKRILDAAAAIAIEHGPKMLTLDNVAKRCGISKGGLTHHFPNKDALLTGMLENMLSLIVTDGERLAEEHDDKLLITNFLRSRQYHHEKLALHEVKILMVAAIENPELLAPMRNLMIEKKAMVAQQPAADESMLLWLAADGLSFQELLGISPFDEDERKALRNKLIDMAVALENEHCE